jgi:hypothetical protein
MKILKAAVLNLGCVYPWVYASSHRGNSKAYNFSIILDLGVRKYQKVENP